MIGEWDDTIESLLEDAENESSLDAEDVRDLLLQNRSTLYKAIFEYIKGEINAYDRKEPETVTLGLLVLLVRFLTESSDVMQAVYMSGFQGRMLRIGTRGNEPLPKKLPMDFPEHLRMLACDLCRILESKTGDGFWKDPRLRQKALHKERKLFQCNNVSTKANNEHASKKKTTNIFKKNHRKKR